MRTFYVILFLALCGVAYWYFGYKPQDAPNELRERGVVVINGTDFNVEIARTPKELAQGLMNRTALRRGHGMLFVFAQPGIYPFWMKDTKIALDIIWINNNRIVDIKSDAQPTTSTDPPAYYPVAQANYALEINGGDSENYGFKIGDQVGISLTK